MAPTPPYATVDDVAARLGRPIETEVETQRVETLLLDASVYVDLNLSTCVATIDAAYPGLLAAVVAGAVARAVETPIGDVSQVRIGDAAMTYMAPGLGGGAKPSTGGLLSSDDIATLRKACGSSSVMPGVRSVPLTSTKGGGETVGVMALADYYRLTVNDTVINLPEPEEDEL